MLDKTQATLNQLRSAKDLLETLYLVSQDAQLSEASRTAIADCLKRQMPLGYATSMEIIDLGIELYEKVAANDPGAALLAMKLMGKIGEIVSNPENADLVEKLGLGL